MLLELQFQNKLLVTGGQQQVCSFCILLDSRSIADKTYEYLLFSRQQVNLANCTPELPQHELKQSPFASEILQKRGTLDYIPNSALNQRCVVQNS